MQESETQSEKKMYSTETLRGTEVIKKITQIRVHLGAMQSSSLRV